MTKSSLSRLATWFGHLQMDLIGPKKISKALALSKEMILLGVNLVG